MQLTHENLAAVVMLLKQRSESCLEDVSYECFVIDIATICAYRLVLDRLSLS